MSSRPLSPSASPASNLSLEERIKTEAKSLGFDWVGITTAEPPPHLDVFHAWLDAGRHGPMDYLATGRARARRANPRAILPECQVVIALGIRYHAPRPAPPARPGPHGRVAAYAWGADYHEALAPRLQALAAFIEAQVGHPVPNRWYTDTGPVLEREFAMRAGLGWIGKNTCLIHPRMGSYFLLAEILLGLALEPDSPFTTGHCGSCTRCLEACPTACILPNRTLDASRCLATLTIELKGPIPAPLRPALGAWVFGCDICQEVCPWNVRFAAPEGDPAFAPRAGVPRPELQAELALDPAAFNRKFKGSPVERAKRRGYLRNVAVALGNAGDPAAIPALAQALHNDPEPLVRGHAAWALGRFREPEARQALAAAAETEQNESVLEEIRAVIYTDRPSKR